MTNAVPWAAIVDYGMGNLFSVLKACESTGLSAKITASPKEIVQAPGVILPGVGAFGDAMAALRERGLVEPLREAAANKPFLGICLGLQLLMSKSFEFGEHEGLGLIEGDVLRLRQGNGDSLKVPQIGWNRIWAGEKKRLDHPLLEGISEGDHLYFVHSFYVKPTDAGVVLARTQYGENDFCSVLARGRLLACQFHPERSGKKGLRIYRNFAKMLRGGGNEHAY